MSEALIIDACRTPRGIGKLGKGALAHLHPQRLAASVLAAIAERNDLDTSKVDDIIWGTSNQSGTQAGDLGRMGALDAGYDVKASGVTLDRFCGSGITSSNFAAGMIALRARRHRHRRRHRHDVDVRGEPRAQACRRSWTPATRTCARSIRSRTRASAATPSPRWKASPAMRSTTSPSSRNSAPPRRSPRAASSAASSRCTTTTARSPSTTTSTRGRRPPARVCPVWRRRSPASTTCRSTTPARRSSR